MNSPDLKKLVTVFLLLASVSSSLVFVFLPSPSYGPPSEGTVSAQQEDKAGLSSLPGISGNAFSEPLPQNNGGNTAISRVPDTNTVENEVNPNNLTDALARSITDEIVKVNPSGPADLGGDPGIALPKAEQVASKIFLAVQNRPQLSNLDWGGISDAPLHVIQNYTSDDIVRYTDQLDSILSERFTKTGFQALVESGISSEDVDLAKGFSEDALRDVLQTPVPQPLLDFHKSLMRLLSFQKNALAFTSKEINDPLKLSLAIRSQEAGYLQAISEFQKQLQTTEQLKKLSYAKQGGVVALLQNTFEIKKAHALFGDWATFLQMVMEWVRELATEFLKDQLIHRLVQQTINWVQGGGKPKFITNFKGFLADNVNESIGEAIQLYAPRLCSSFGPLIQISLLPRENVPNDYLRCTLTDVIKNVKAFYNDFQSGGWVAYAASLNPNNNFFGSFIQLSDEALLGAAKAHNAASKEALANNGFLSTKKCIKNDPVTGECLGEITTTPGETVGSQLDQSLGSAIHRIVNAQDFIALISALINSGINRLFQMGKNGITGLFQGGAGGSPPVGGGAGGGVSAADLATQKSNLIFVADTYIGSYQNIINNNTTWLATVPGVVSSLQSLTSICPSLSGDANARIATINLETQNIQNEIQDSTSAIPALQTIKTQINQAVDLVELASLQQQIDAINPSLIDLNSQTRLQKLSALQISIGANSGGSCGIPLAAL